MKFQKQQELAAKESLKVQKQEESALKDAAKLQKIQDKVPILGDIPVLGWLFKSKSRQIEKVNLLFFYMVARPFWG